MSARQAMVAIDLGAESCRVSLLRWQRGVPHIELVHRHPHAPVARNGELHWDLDQITQQMDAGLRKCAEIAEEGICSVAADGWAVDYVRLAEDGSPIGAPFCYRDERTLRSQAEVWQRIQPERLRSITGTEMNRINTLYQLYADSPELQSKPWLNLPEYVLYRLGGRPVAEYTNATHTQLVDATRRDWSDEVFASTGLSRSAAPPIVRPGTVLGELKGIAGLEGAALIAPACHDTASAIAGIADSGHDWAYISSGTWSLVGTLLEEPSNGPDAQAADFTNLGAVGGRICFHKNVNGMWLLRQCMTEWANAIDWTVPELIKAAEPVPAPAYLLNVDDPDLLLPGDMPARINRQLARRGLPPVAEGAEAAPEMTSLICHSLAARYAEIVSRIASISEKKLRRIYIVGGGSRNTLLNRLTAAATGLEVRCGAVESATIGNFAVQLAALEGPRKDGVDGAAVADWAQQILTA
jgi:rhamnulokinase